MSKSKDIMFLAAYSILIFWLSHQPSLPVPWLFFHQDKLVHCIAYSMMGWLSWRCFAHLITHRTILTAATLSYCFVYALTDEWHQSFVPGRSADLLDWVADATGSSITVFIVRLKSENTAYKA